MSRDGRFTVSIFVNEILPAAPAVTVQVAHLWGGGELSEEALAVSTDAVASGESRARNLYFDLTEFERFAGGSDDVVARYVRRIGMDRLLYGTCGCRRIILPRRSAGAGS